MLLPGSFAGIVISPMPLRGPDASQRTSLAIFISAPARVRSAAEVWTSASCAESAAKAFGAAYGAKWPKATAKITEDLDVLLEFYDYPAEHWKHIRTSNPIESTFATVRHRTKRTKGCLSRRTGLAMAFKLMMSAQEKWRKLDGQNRLPEIIQGIEFRDGLRQLQAAA